MPPVEFEPIISAGERPKTYALDRAATGTGTKLTQPIQILIIAGNLKTFVTINIAIVSIN
jgi:hypothetical protein